MQLRTEARDCLYLNWAVPRAALPSPPAPLRYELHRWRDVDVVFLSALLFRLTGLRPTSLPFPALSYPQMSLRLYVLDEESVSSVLFRRVMVPPWVVPISRFLGRQPARAGLFSFPRPSAEPDVGSWHWSLRGGALSPQVSLAVDAELASPRHGDGPTLGDWRRTVDYFRRRPRGYVTFEGRLRAIKRSHPTVDVWPLDAQVSRHGLLEHLFPQVDPECWTRPHSAWLCPEIPFEFEVGQVDLLPMPRRVPAAVPDGA
ncbi:MAG: DUF2071 domain-containing protein [Acidobacteriota bacterium]